MSEWVRAPLQEFLTRITYGFTNPMPTTGSGPYMITAKDINDGRILYEQARSTSQHAFDNLITDKSRPDLGDVLVTKDGTLGRVAIVDRPNVCINQSVALLKPSPAIRPRFLRYLLEYPPNFNRMLNDADGTTIKHIYITRLGKMPVSVPNLDRQDEIVSTLSALDDKIELNRRMNETLEQMAQAIFKDWFVDFGPVRRKQEGASDPIAIMGSLVQNPARAAELAALFPDAFGDDGLPEGWGKATVGAEFNLTMGQSPPGETYNDEGNGLPFFQGRTDFGFRFPENRKFCSQPGRIAEADDTLVSVRAPVGDLNVAWEKCCIGRGVASIRHRAGAASYTYYALKNLQPDLQQFEHSGTVFGAINRKQFDALTVIKPGTPLIRSFEEFANPFDSMIRARTAESSTLGETRDYLLPKLMSGEVRVRDANKLKVAENDEISV